jgi:hypothetical protein
MITNDTQFIDKKQVKDSASDFEFLVGLAMDLVQRHTGHTWTDYNLHDPGITILEQVCFAITDLAYKTNFAIEDILADPNGTIDRAQHSFFDKDQILTCNPITINDFRKVLLDEIKEIDNVMVVPVTSTHASSYIKGLYKIFVRANNTIAKRFYQQPELKSQLEEKVAGCYLSKRNLGEDLIDVTILEPQKIDLYSDIIIRYSNSPEEILVNIYNKLESILNPKISFYTEKELLDSGMTVEDIYAGPMLKNGFLPDSELKPIESEIDPIELINAIMQVEGVVFVQNICINNDKACGNEKPFILDKNHFPLLDITSFFKNINLFTDEYELQLKEKTFNDLINRTAQLRSQKRKTVYPSTAFIKKGNYCNPGKYYSLQHHFPIAYGIGNEGLLRQEPDERKAAAHQLKAYLLFFEQILANYLGQVENIGKLYSTDVRESNQHSYYCQALYDVPGIKDLLNAFTSLKQTDETDHWEKFKANPENGYIRSLRTSQETPEEYINRKNHILDHLLARFNRNLAPLPVLEYFNLYVQGTAQERAAYILQWKANILSKLTQLDQNRTRSFNYLTTKKEFSGFEEITATYLHIKQGLKRNRLTSVFNDGKIAFVSEKLENGFHTHNSAGNKLKWNDDYITIDDGSDEVIGLSEIGKLIAGGIHQNHAYIIHKRGIGILKYGINIENYKIIPSPNGGEGVVIIFKFPIEEKWSMISRHPDKAAALTALHKLINYFRKLSIESEGYYVLEHALLRPDLNSLSFGFRFCSGNGETIFKNDRWTSFDEREDIIAQIKQAAQQGNNPPEQAKNNFSSSIPFQIKNQGVEDYWEQASSTDFLLSRNVETYKCGEELRIISLELEKLNVDKTRTYPRFEMLVRLPDGTVQPEGLYNLQITIVFPAWPARFQDADFRSFTENLLCATAPAYLRFHFKWLGVSQMKKFEDLYFGWLDVLSENKPDDERNNSSAAIVKWLNSSNTKKQQ